MALKQEHILEDQLNNLLNRIVPIDSKVMKQAKHRWNSIAKPIGSLGKLEELVIQLAGIARDGKNISINKKALLVYCGDHGVVSEGVTQTGPHVTRIVADNFANNASCVNVMAETAGVDVYPIDIGMIGSAYPVEEMILGKVIHRKIAQGTHNIAIEPAMSKMQCIEAIMVGVKAVEELKNAGYNAIATGEMGIGNTTPTSAMAAIYLDQPVEKIAGKGAGLSEEGFMKKKDIIGKIIKRHVENGYGNQPLEVLTDIGGYEIAGMVGTFLGGAIYQVPVLMDGVISEIAALTAVRMNKDTKGYIVASHESKEPASRLILEELGLEPVICCDMRLGEGSGAVAAFPIITMGLRVYEHMSTFDDNAIESYEDYNHR